MNPSPSLLTPVLAAIAILLVATLGPLALYRSINRRSRRDWRSRTHQLETALRAFSLGDSSARDVRRALHGSDDAAFWQCLERFDLTRAQRRKLGHLLERSRLVRLERVALREDTGDRQRLAATRLGLLDSPRARRALRRALRAAAGPLVPATALALARLGDRVAFRFVLARPELFARCTSRFRVTLLRAFGPGALPLLHDALEGERLDPTLARAALETIGAGRYRPAAAAVARRLRDGEPELRVAATRALGQLGASEHTMSLRRCLDDAHWPVRAQAARALGRLRAHHCEDALASCLTDRSWWVRRHAAYALADLGEPGHAALLHVIEHSPDPYAREMAEEALNGGWLDRSA